MHWHPSLFRPGIGHGFPGTHVQSLVGTGVDTGRPKSDRTHLHSGQGMEMAFRNPCLFLLRNGHGAVSTSPPKATAPMSIPTKERRWLLESHVHSLAGMDMGRPKTDMGRVGPSLHHLCAIPSLIAVLALSLHELCAIPSLE